MATSKKGGKRTPKKAKARIVKKAKPKASPKKKARAVKKAKKAPAKAVKKNKPKAAIKTKAKAAPKAKKAAPKSKKAAVTTPAKKTTRAVAEPAPARRGEGVVAQTTIDRLYIVNDSDDNITLEVKAGDKGQTSDMTIQLDDVMIIEEHPGDFNKTIIGTNKGLVGKKLSIVATIADTSRETNLTSLAISLIGGPSPVTFPLSKEVSEEGESVDYLALIEFFRP